MNDTTNSNARVSVVMPTYNAESYMRETIETVRSQSIEDWELLIIDDRSSDNTLQIAKQYSSNDRRISVHQLEKNSGGPARPRNFGVALAKGEWIAFLDADDLWHPRKLEHQLDSAAKTDADFLCTGLKNFSRAEAIDFFDFETSTSTKVGYFRQRWRTTIANSSVVVRRDIASRFAFEEGAEFRAVEDYHCWLRILKDEHSCLKLNSPYLAYRISAGQISKGKWSQVKKVFHVHQSMPMAGKLRILPSSLFTITHVLGAVFSRVLLGRM